MLIPLAYLVICTVLLTLPGSAIPKDNWFDRMWMDKWVHLGMFFLLTILWCYAFKRRGKANLKVFTWILGLAILYGVLMEFVQHYWIPHRSYDPGDMIADAAGALLGFWVSSKRYLKK